MPHLWSLTSLGALISWAPPQSESDPSLLLCVRVIPSKRVFLACSPSCVCSSTLSQPRVHRSWHSSGDSASHSIPAHFRAFLWDVQFVSSSRFVHPKARLLSIRAISQVSSSVARRLQSAPWAACSHCRAVCFASWEVKVSSWAAHSSLVHLKAASLLRGAPISSSLCYSHSQSHQADQSLLPLVSSQLSVVSNWPRLAVQYLPSHLLEVGMENSSSPWFHYSQLSWFSNRDWVSFSEEWLLSEFSSLF